MAWMEALKAATLLEIGSELLKKALFGAGEVVGKKIMQDFGGENNPADEHWNMESSLLLDSAKRKIWFDIEARMNDNGGDGPFTARSRDKKATTRRVNFAAMIKDIPVPTIKEEIRNDKGKVVKTIYTPDPNFRPTATRLKEECVDMFLAEQQAQVSAGKNQEEATNIAQQKVEVLLSSAGFPIVSDRNPYRHLDEFIVKVPENALKAAKAMKALIGKMAVGEIASFVKATLAGVDSEADTIRNNAITPFQKWRAERRIRQRASR